MNEGMAAIHGRGDLGQDTLAAGHELSAKRNPQLLARKRGFCFSDANGNGGSTPF